MEDKSNPGAKKSWLTICGRIVWLLLLAVFIFIGGLAVFAIGTSRDTIIPELVLVFALTGIFLLTLIRLLFSRRFRRPVLFFLLSLVTLVALFYAEEDWRGKHAWNRCQSEWVAKGEKIDWQSVIPPAVPDDHNFAMTPVVASGYRQILDGQGHENHPIDTNIVDRLRMDIYGGHDDNKVDLGNWGSGSRVNLAAWQTFYRTLGAKTNLFPVPPQPQSPAADVLLALTPFGRTIEDLRQAAQLPESRFPLEYDKEVPGSILLPHLAAMKRSGIVLSLRADAELQDNQSAAAAADVNLTFRLIDAIHSEPFLISHLVRIALLQIDLQPVWEGLADHRWSDAQLKGLDADLVKLNFAQDYNIAMKGEVTFGEHSVDYVRQSRPDFQPYYNFSDDGKSDEFNVPAGVVSWIPAGWFYQNQVNYANMMLKYYLPIADVEDMTISPSAEHQADHALAADTRHFVPYKLLEKFLVPAGGHVGNKFARAQAFADMARVAIALERFRLVQGAYPPTLDMLAPQFLAEIPHDVIDGQPLHYRVEASGRFTLYSVGWNGRDDGGTVVLSKGSSPGVNYNEGDWVWRYPKQ
jgi:hypothetical protein